MASCFQTSSVFVPHALVFSATIPYTVLVWSELGSWAVGEEGTDTAQATLRHGPDPDRQEAGFETQKSQKAASQHHRHEVPETRKWRSPVLQTGRLVGNSCWERWHCYTCQTGLHVVAAASRILPLLTTQFLSRWSLVLVNYECLACQLEIEKAFWFSMFCPCLSKMIKSL